MKYSITHTNRKTIAIYIHNDGSVEVRCNKSTPKSSIEKFINQKHKWIDEKVALILKKNEIKNNWKINVGSTLLLMGKEYPVIKAKDNSVGFDGHSFCIPQQLEDSQIKPYIINIYKNIAKIVIIDKAKKFSNIMRLAPTSVKINSAKTLWGSCSSKKSINYSWQLIMAEESVIDYVVIHEFAHIVELNHSEKFWGIVNSVCPDYKEKIQKLKALQEKLSNEDW